MTVMITFAMIKQDLIVSDKLRNLKAMVIKGSRKWVKVAVCKSGAKRIIQFRRRLISISNKTSHMPRYQLPKLRNPTKRPVRISLELHQVRSWIDVTYMESKIVSGSRQCTLHWKIHLVQLEHTEILNYRLRASRCCKFLHLTNHKIEAFRKLVITQYSNKMNRVFK